MTMTIAQVKSVFSFLNNDRCAMYNWVTDKINEIYIIQGR